jgi:hypothetical protein
VKINPAVLSGGFGKSFKGLLDSLELSDNLLLCLDAGFNGSFDGVTDTQIWKDISGNNRNWYRGATSSSEASDPTFNGTPGNLSENEYWSFDGGDYFIQESEDFFVKPLHSDGGQGTIIAIASAPTSALYPIFFGGGPGRLSQNIYFNGYRFELGFATSLQPSTDERTVGIVYGPIAEPSGISNWFSGDTRPKVSSNVMTFVGAKHVDNTSKYVFYNKVKYSNTFTGSGIQNLNSADPSLSHAYYIGRGIQNSGFTAASSGCKLWCLAIFDTSLTDEQIELIYDTLKLKRFPSLPV